MGHPVGEELCLKKMSLIKLFENERLMAVEWADRITSKPWIKRGKNYTRLEEHDRWFVGECGELAFQKWLKYWKIPFEKTSRDDGHADKQDFIVWARDGRPARIGVKNTHSARGRNLMMPVSQYKDLEEKGTLPDIWVGCSGRDTGREVGILIWGAIPELQFAAIKIERMVKVPSYMTRLDKLPYTLCQFRKTFGGHK